MKLVSSPLEYIQGHFEDQAKVTIQMANSSYAETANERNSFSGMVIEIKPSGITEGSSLSKGFLDLPPTGGEESFFMRTSAQ